MASEIHHSTTHQYPKQTRKKQPFAINLNDDPTPIPLQTPNIPQEIIIEILSRLPVKSLVRFRCVCRSWLSLISDRQFARTHLERLIKNDALDPFRLIVRYPYYNLKSCSLYSIFREPFGYAVDLDYPWRNLRGAVRIVGSCNGLVCLSLETGSSFNFFLWNPSTRESNILSDSSFGSSYDYQCVLYGFGYDCSGDDYKVVRVGCEHGAPAPEVTVYSLRTDSWRRIQDFPYGIYSKESGKLVNGALNWLATRHDNNSNESLIIASFDLAEEVFREVPQPNYGYGIYNLFVRVLGDCLCMLCDRTGICVDVWIMKEYGVKESWTKLASVPYMPEMKPLDFSKSLCFSKYGGILMYFGDILVLYDLNEKTFQYPMIYGVRSCHEADIYLETLVSPSAYNGNER